jgi:hypothetical protein
LYESFVLQIPRNFNDDYKRRLEDGLRHLYQYSLRKRLKDLLEKISKNYSSELLKDYKEAKRRQSFSDLVTNTRNYLTHFDKKPEDKIAEGEELINVTEELKILLEVCLLKEIGFSANDVDTLIYKQYNYRIIV